MSHAAKISFDFFFHVHALYPTSQPSLVSLYLFSRPISTRVVNPVGHLLYTTLRFVFLNVNCVALY